MELLKRGLPNDCKAFLRQPKLISQPCIKHKVYFSEGKNALNHSFPNAIALLKNKEKANRLKAKFAIASNVLQKLEIAGQ